MKTILIVDDEPRLLQSLEAGLKVHQDSFSVLTAPNGEEAVAVLSSTKIDLVITDLKMSKMDGFELLERLRNVPVYAELPIMMLTSMGREEDIARGFDLGADDYMVKPFSPVEVLARVRRLLKMRNPNRPATGNATCG